ncbi:MAG: hypothetical protein NAG76_07575 [Candidatus Pristimantibacillus lignocellulolyticus]|uniref:Uncharacterized protein n=1 Tax=Candidatus Pristimantibacillus lignocellulolyticus TaxID=2994561 RepID=A0A9J6ZIX5_9BACL|nr:MAG: hypothetical protein NAG76_07575 [Candidatus Pristimantibacillus lignocellulolyticus]
MSKLKWLGASAILAVGIISGSLIGNALSVGTSSVTPGTVSDPVVTKSYVDEQMAKLSGGGSTGGTTTATLEVVTVPADRILMVKAGSEIVIRSGKAIAYSSDSNGISDVTDGVDIKNGVAVPTNHEIWFPRDGRGVQAAAGTTGSLIVLVKGSYYLQ